MKTIFQSKTFWFNVLLGLLGVSTLVGANELTSIGIDGILQNRILAALGVFNILGNIVLRAATNTAIQPIKPFRKKPIGGTEE